MSFLKEIISPSGTPIEYSLFFFYYVKAITSFRLPYSVALSLGVSRNAYNNIIGAK